MGREGGGRRDGGWVGGKMAEADTMTDTLIDTKRREDRYRQT